jgi:hypothetical protein
MRMSMSWGWLMARKSLRYSLIALLVIVVSLTASPFYAAADLAPNKPIYPAGALSEEELDVAEAAALGPVDFRIVDIRSEHGQLVVEVEHFDPYGNFAYYELYTWQGREGNIHNIATNDQGLLLLDDMTPAPTQANMAGLDQQYLPPGREWARDVIPRLNADAITGVISMIHRQRGVSWIKGKQRLTVHPLDYTEADMDGRLALWAALSYLSGTSYTKDPYGDIVEVEYDGPGGPREMPAITHWGTTSTFTPSMDGYINNAVGSVSWSTMRDAVNGTAITDTGVNNQTYLKATTTTDEWNNTHRSVFLFDTNTLPDGDAITAATFKFASGYKDDSFGASAVLVASNPTGDSGLVVADYSRFTFTDQAARLAYASVNTGGTVVNEMALNATGLGNISKTGITKFGVVDSYDADDSPPTWYSNRDGWIQIKSKDSAVPPQLVITHSSATAAVTGTIGDGATEQEVRDGGGTILVTLSDETWVAAGATFDAQRQNIIDGLDAADAQAAGWNAQVRDQLNVTSVVRDSDTLVTITIAAGDVTGYAITSTETITVTVPATAVTGGGAITATPTIAITAVTESAAITGTIGDGATEQEVRDGGGTILVTLTNTKWVADGATFDAQRQNIIDGLDAADAQAAGWNAQVRDQLNVTSVVRDSDTLVTITIAAGDVTGYAIVTNEVITVTVPATAIGGTALTATPTFTITAGTESAAITGTISDGATSPEIQTGGQTAIVTLTNTTWVAAGATFDAQRQNIIDGFVSASSETNGWNNRRSDFAVTDVVRTSAIIVTVTFSASSTYTISAAETITLTVPATAIGGTALTATPTFVITPNFVSSGTWISPAIDLSSIIDTAYCAVGWSESIPAGTSAAVEYSSDGGGSYSTATNGSCPFTIGGTLAAVSDFRIKVTLATTDTTVTPTITALGFIAGTTGGQTVRYQLNTTPALTATDRTGNAYSGTMSFPALPTGVSTTVGSMTALRAPPSAQTARGIPQVTSPVTGTAVSDNIFNTDETGWTGLPGYQLVNTMATAGDGLPVQFIWYIMLGLVTIMLGFFALNLTQSLFAAGVAMALGLGASIAMGGGLIPGWVIFVFIPVAIGMIFLRPRLAI